MIPGTASETAALALWHLKAAIGGATVQEIADAQTVLSLAERRELVAAGKLATSSWLPCPVALDVDLVEVVPTHPEPCDDIQAIYQGHWHGEFAASVQRALNDTATGRHELWFDAEGNAFLSFEHEEDATLFRLALDA